LNTPTINSDFSTITNNTDISGIPHLNGASSTTFTKIVNNDLNDNSISGQKISLETIPYNRLETRFADANKFFKLDVNGKPSFAT
jgi:hypothetical protein